MKNPLFDFFISTSSTTVGGEKGNKTAGMTIVNKLVELCGFDTRKHNVIQNRWRYMAFFKSTLAGSHQYGALTFEQPNSRQHTIVDTSSATVV